MVDYNKNIIIGYIIGNITHDSYFEKKYPLYIYTFIFIKRYAIPWILKKYSNQMVNNNFIG